MRKKNVFICLVFVLIISSGMALAAGEEKWPTKPIEVIVGFPPGGAADMAARIYAPIMSKQLGVPVVVVNKPGAGGAAAVEFVSKAKPDGYTLMESTLTLISAYPHMYHVNYTIDDFTYILSHTGLCAALLVRKEAPWKTYNEFLDYAKKSPKGVTFATSSLYTTAHIVFTWIAQHEKFKFSVVPFQGSGEVLPALMGGHVDCAGSSGGHAALIEAGRVRTLLQLSGEVADNTIVPYVQDVYPKFPANVQSATETPKLLYGPKGIPAPIVQTLANALRKGIESEEFKRYAKDSNYKIVVWDSAKLYQAAKIDNEGYGDILKSMGYVKK